MRYFPLIPRLKLSYADPELAMLYQWHAVNQNETEVTGPVDGTSWKQFREKYPTKMADPQSLLLGLAMDGVSPFKMSGHSTPYSIWPVIVNTYNLPPWLATKHGYCWLVMILPGPDQIPQDKLDTYLRPLIEELLKLWTGVEAIDGSIASDIGPRQFTLRAALFCTMHDWPGLEIYPRQVDSS